MSKIVASTAGLIDPQGGQNFTDVPTDAPFYLWVQNLAVRGYISGYACGGINPQTQQSEPCDAQNRHYFRPGNNITRAQAAKIVWNTYFPGCDPR